ncbi:MAG: prepilin-type N-terminal cleavage/methylation domain-containing protein [Verrucomicrobiales bacterium]|nr:prepilin-type N-terminal cleavage/methylation domain-containing protein [Verrucomicrobiales bacterium]
MKNRGFTLVEIVIAMTILALISGTVMAILVQAGDTAAEIRDTDLKDEEVSRFLELLERTVETLPIDATIEMLPAAETISGFPEMKISNAVGAFTFGEDIGSAGELVIGLQPQQESENEGQFFELAISRDSFSPEDTDGDGMVFGAGSEDFLTADAEGRYWLPLVSDIISASWRYWDEESNEWLTEWQGENLPPLLEFSVEDSHRPGPVRVVFEVPEHLVTGETVSTDTSTTDTETTSTTTNRSTSAGPNQPGGGGQAGEGGRPGGGKGGKGGGKGGGGRQKGGKGQNGGGGGPQGGGPGNGGPRGGAPNGGGQTPPTSGGGGGQ